MRSAAGRDKSMLAAKRTSHFSRQPHLPHPYNIRKYAGRKPVPKRLLVRGPTATEARPAYTQDCVGFVRARVAHEAARAIQCAARAKLARLAAAGLREAARREVVVQKCLHRLHWRVAYATFAAWRKYAAQNRAVKAKLRKLFARHKEYFFNAWADWLARRKAQHAEDEVRKEKAMRYWFHRCLAPCFVAWVTYTEGSLRVKGMFMKQMMGIQRRLFERWYAFVEWKKKRRFAHFLARNLADRVCEETLDMIVDWCVVAFCRCSCNLPLPFFSRFPISVSPFRSKMPTWIVLHFVFLFFRSVCPCVLPYPCQTTHDDAKPIM